MLGNVSRFWLSKINYLELSLSESELKYPQLMAENYLYIYIYIYWNMYIYIYIYEPTQEKLKPGGWSQRFGAEFCKFLNFSSRSFFELGIFKNDAQACQNDSQDAPGLILRPFEKHHFCSHMTHKFLSLCWVLDWAKH